MVEAVCSDDMRTCEDQCLCELSRQWPRFLELQSFLRWCLWSSIGHFSLTKPPWIARTRLGTRHMLTTCSSTQLLALAKTKTAEYPASAHGHRIVHVVFMFAIFAIFTTSLKVWWKGQQIQQRDEVEAAQAGADVLWKSSKTTSYRRCKTGMNNGNLMHPPFAR